MEFFWSTAEAIYATKVMADNVEYHERKYDEKRVAFGNALVDAQGRVNAKFTAPEDFGEVHDLYAVIDGQDVGARRFSHSPQRHINAQRRAGGNADHSHGERNGLAGLRAIYGAALRQQIHRRNIGSDDSRAPLSCKFAPAGPPGKHIIQLNNSTAYAPGAYLNTQQSPQDYIYAHLDNQQEFRFVFNVTKDAGPPPDTLQWPDSDRVARAQQPCAADNA